MRITDPSRVLFGVVPTSVGIVLGAVAICVSVALARTP